MAVAFDFKSFADISPQKQTIYKAKNRPGTPEDFVHDLRMQVATSFKVPVITSPWFWKRMIFWRRGAGE
jgi:hypothetical protein